MGSSIIWFEIGRAAEDLAQETFLRIYRARNGYEPRAKFSTWLFHIANNLASNKRRDKGRRKEVKLNPSESGPLGARPEEQILKDKSALMPTRQVDKSELASDRAGRTFGTQRTPTNGGAVEQV